MISSHANANVTEFLKCYFVCCRKVISFATLETRRELEPKCVLQLFLGSLLGARRSAIGQFSPVANNSSRSLCESSLDPVSFSLPIGFIPLDTRELRNDDGDGNENGKKAIGLDWPNNNFARASRFFVHCSAFVARLQR